MKILIKSEGHTLRLWLPLSWVPWRLVIKAIAHEADVAIDPQVAKEAKKVLREYRQKYGKLVLADISDANGDIVKIIV